MSNTILVSIVTACFNSEKTLRDTMESILSQTYPNIEHIIKDGYSTDQTVAIAEEYRENYADRGIILKIIRGRDSGIYEAMNEGIKKAEGKLIGLLNSDDWYERDAVERVIREYRQKKFNVLCGDILIHNRGTVIRKKVSQKKFKTTRDWAHPGMFVEKEYYDKIGLYREEKKYYSDYDWFLRACRDDADITVLNQVLAHFRIGGTTTKKSFTEMKNKISERYFDYRNNGYSRWYILECLLQEIGKFILVKE